MKPPKFLLMLPLLIWAACAGSERVTGGTDAVAARADTTTEATAGRDTLRAPVPRYVPQRGVAPADPVSSPDLLSPSSHAAALPGTAESFLQTHGIESNDWPFLIGRGMVRMPGCSGAVASAYGLVITSYECIRRVISVPNSLPDEAFVAATGPSEQPIDDLSVTMVVGVVDVSAAVSHRQAQGLDTGVALASVRDSLVNGRPDRGVSIVPGADAGFAAVVFQRHDDVRLVFLPHREVADFGGDLDAGSYPQYKINAALLRVYEQGRPAATPWHYKWDPEAPADDGFLFAVGAAPENEIPGGEAVDAGFGPLWVTSGSALPIPSPGTSIPARASFFGMYDRHHSFGAGSAWRLPESWARPMPGISLSVAVSLAVTNALSDGMLGGPLLDENRSIRGIIYDTNHEMTSLLPEDVQSLRAVVVTSAALSDALRSAYEAAHIVRELESGTLTAE